MEKKSILDLFSFYREASSSVQEEMLGLARLARLPKDARYLTEGDKTDIIALVGEGHLRVFKTSETGREITLYGVGSGEFCILNLMCVLTGITSPATARVEEAVEAVVFQGQDFRRWIGSAPAIRTHVFALLTHSVAEIMSLVEEIAFKRMDVRLADYLRTRQGNSNIPTLEVTHERIASDLGTAREVVSRLLKEFERQGAVKLARGCITVSNEGVLKKLAGSA